MLSIWTSVMDLQEDIGWNSYIQGFWHNKWRLVQDRHISMLKQTYCFDQWSTSVLFALLTYIYKCWKLRNKQIHDPLDGNEHTWFIHHQVCQLYLDPDRYLYQTREKRHLFSTPIHKKLKYSNASLELWIDLVEVRL